jgi:hypothetical protein
VNIAPKPCERCGTTYQPSNPNQKRCEPCRAIVAGKAPAPGRSRETRLRKVAPGAADDLVTALAALPAAEVELVTRLARQARRDEREHQAQARRQRKADARRHGWYDEQDYVRRNLAVVRSQGNRAAGGSLEALAALGQLRRHADTWIMWGVDGCRSGGYSDEEIGQALGVTRQAVGQHFGRKGTFTGEAS